MMLGFGLRRSQGWEVLDILVGWELWLFLWIGVVHLVGVLVMGAPDPAMRLQGEEGWGGGGMGAVVAGVGLHGLGGSFK